MSLSTAEQVAAIQNTLGKPNPIPNYAFTFGKYKGDTLESVAHKDKQYLKWLYHNVDRLNPMLEQYIENHIL